MQFLTFPAEQPIEKNFRRVRMRRAPNDTDDAVAAAHVSSFFQRRQMFDRQVRIQKRVEIPIAYADGQR